MREGCCKKQTSRLLDEVMDKKGGDPSLSQAKGSRRNQENVTLLQRRASGFRTHRDVRKTGSPLEDVPEIRQEPDACFSAASFGVPRRLEEKEILGSWAKHLAFKVDRGR